MSLTGVLNYFKIGFMWFLDINITPLIIILKPPNIKSKEQKLQQGTRVLTCGQTVDLWFLVKPSTNNSNVQNSWSPKKNK